MYNSLKGVVVSDRKENNLAPMVLFCFVAVVAGLLFYSHNRSDSTVRPTASSTATPPTTSQPSEAEMDQFSQDYENAQADQASQMQADMQDNTVSQSYYYCWDTGAPAPHHLGYRASGDHYCTNGELHDSGVSGY